MTSQTADREKKGKTNIQKFEYLENEKSFLDEIRSIFHSFWRAIIWWKVKIIFLAEYNGNLSLVVLLTFTSEIILRSLIIKLPWTRFFVSSSVFFCGRLSIPPRIDPSKSMIYHKNIRYNFTHFTQLHHEYNLQAAGLPSLLFCYFHLCWLYNL